MERDTEKRPLRLEKAEREYFHALFLTHSRDLRGYAVSLGFRGDAADDLLQETFLVAIRRYDALRGCASPKAYLIRILRNVVGYRLRSMKYAEGLAERLRERSAEEYRDDVAAEILYRGLVSDGELWLLLRHYRDGVPQKELAAELGVELGALKMRLKRAREHLKAALEQEGLL